MLLIAFSSFTYGRDNAHVVNLRCDKMENPIVIESRQPVLQWQLASDERGKRQTAYRIIVSGSLKQLNKGKGDYWDSGKVSSSESVINYRGKPLSSGAQLYWKVMVWDENNTPTKWSEASSWIIETIRLEGKMDRADRRFISGFDADISGTVFS